ncbi:diguanylate cyclase [bacterium]|nr:diguanylate cyclase [FCB group bacterium]MBL7190092.1 diguanylate cyclase [bacterium]
MGFNILVVEDFRETRELIGEVLQNNIEYDVILSEDGEDALRKFKEHKFDLVISDIKMPKKSGLELLKDIQNLDPETPVVLITGFGDDYGAKALELGAEDCVFKPFNTNELMLRVERVLKYSKMRQLKDMLMMKNEELRKMAITDSLSLLFNRRHFIELLEREFSRAQRYNLNLSCVMLDVDYFKEINDNHGHLAGDYVIQKIGALIKEEIREIDIPARYGGDEFIILLPETEKGGTMTVANRLFKRCGSENYTREATKRRTSDGLKITISVGVAIYPKEGIIHPNDLMKAADDALLKAKEEGKNRIIVV